jgi:hypothetical protein
MNVTSLMIMLLVEAKLFSWDQRSKVDVKDRVVADATGGMVGRG